MEGNKGSRIGACLCFVFLTFVSLTIVAIIFSLLGIVGYYFEKLPYILSSILIYAFWPIILGIIISPASMFLSWASECSERICPTRNGLRYKTFFVIYIISIIINVIALITKLSPFEPNMLLSVLYAIVFYSLWQNHKNY